MTLQALLGTALPIIQAPMAGVQGTALTVAVSSAGGLGSLPCALLGVDALRQELANLRAQTTRPFNVNFFCHASPAPDARREAAWRTLLAPYFAELGIDADQVPTTPARASFNHAAADVLAEFRPAVVSFHFGLPSEELLARVRSWGAKVLSSATTVEEARWLEARGVDAIIAQGLEATGTRHRQPSYARTRADERPCARFSPGQRRRRAVACEGREPGPQRLLAALGGTEHQRLQRGFRWFADP